MKNVRVFFYSIISLVLLAVKDVVEFVLGLIQLPIRAWEMGKDIANDIDSDDEKWREFFEEKN